MGFVDRLACWSLTLTSSAPVEEGAGLLDTNVNEKPFTSLHSSENYISHFEAGTEFTAGVEPADPLVSVVREELFAVRLGQLSTRYVSRRPAQEN